jgi:hypothetical protein
VVLLLRVYVLATTTLLSKNITLLLALGGEIYSTQADANQSKPQKEEVYDVQDEQSRL